MGSQEGGNLATPPVTSSAVTPAPAGPTPQETAAANKAHEEEVKGLRAQIGALKTKHEADKRATRRAAIAYAINIWSSKSAKLTRDFLREALRLFQQYTFLRRALSQRDEQLKKATQRTLEQETVISELRQFLEEHRHAMAIIDEHL